MGKAERRWAAHGYKPKECSVLEALDCARRSGFGEGAIEDVIRLCYTIDREKLAYPVKLVAVPADDAAGAGCSDKPLPAVVGELEHRAIPVGASLERRAV
jgi:hypothetical protein